MENKNKSQYDWFKGPQAAKQDKDFKQRAKDAFKWAKIFSYVALFTFSMFGCVQVFTIRTENTVGQGVEIYHNADEIAPTISTTTFTNAVVFGPDAADGTKEEVPSNEVYFSTTNQMSSIWINKNEDADLLTQVHDDVKVTQGVELKDAWKGVNSGIVNRVVEADGQTYIDINGDKQDVLNFPSVGEELFGLQDQDAIDEFNSIKVSTDSNDNVLVFSSAAETYATNTPMLPSFFVPVQESKVWDATIEDYEPTYKTIEISFPDPNTLEGKDQARLKMANEILTSYLMGTDEDGNVVPSPLFNFLGSEDEATALALAEDTTFVNDWDEDDVVYANETQYYRMTVLSQVLYAAGFEFDFADIEFTNEDGKATVDKDHDVVSDIEYKEGKMVGYISSSTAFRPITTWGDAFSLGPFYGFFVYPIGYITSNLVAGMGDLSGWESMMTIFLVVFAIRMLTFALSYKSTMAQSRMQDLNGKKAIIEAKYTQYEGNKQMEMRKRQEVADLYKKNGINPMASLGTMFLTMPFFLAIWRVIGGIPHLKAASWLGITFSATSYQEFFAGEWQYLPLMLIAAAIQLLSQLYPRLINRKQNNERLNAAQKEAMKKANKTQNITMGVFVFMSVIFTAGIQIYWIIGGLWRLIEVRVTHHLKEKDKSKRVK